MSTSESDIDAAFSAYISKNTISDVKFCIEQGIPKYTLNSTNLNDTLKIGSKHCCQVEYESLNNFSTLLCTIALSVNKVKAIKDWTLSDIDGLFLPNLIEKSKTIQTKYQDSYFCTLDANWINPKVIVRSPLITRCGLKRDIQPKDIVILLYNDSQIPLKNNKSCVIVFTELIAFVTSYNNGIWSVFFPYPCLSNGKLGDPSSGSGSGSGVFNCTTLASFIKLLYRITSGSDNLSIQFCES